MDALLSAAQWVVGKALAPVADGVLEAWDASKNLGLNIEALRTELLLVQATLELASRKQIDGQAMEVLLWKLRDSACCAEDLLDEINYFRIHDELHGSHDAADHHAKGGIHDLALNSRHTARAVLGSSSAAPATLPEPGQRVGCCAWPRARRRSGNKSSSMPNTNQADDEEVSGCMPKLGKLLPCSSSPNVLDDNSAGQSTLCDAPQREHAEETPTLEFNRVDVSQRMNQIVQQLQPLRREFTTMLQICCDRITVPDIAQRPITTGQSIEPKLYGRDDVVNSLIHDMTKGKYHNKDLTVLPIVGPGGIGKTTLIQHIYRDKEVQNHFQVVIWVCVSLSFNPNKLLEDIKKDTLPVEGEKENRPEELIEQRLKSKRFLLVLDDIWGFSNEDDWIRLLLPLKTSEAKGNMILVTTRFPAIAKMVKTTDHIELEGLESGEFRKLFLAFVFGDEPYRSDHSFLLEIGDKIIEKLKGSPLAAKTIGRLLRKDLNLRHWRRVLESKEWERQTGVNDIMPALKLSYDYLPFHQQQCFSRSALFPEDYMYTSTDLINLWIGLDILQTGGRNQTLEDIGLSNFNDLVKHGFFKEKESNEEESNDRPFYVMHDLLHDLALKVTSHDSISLHRSNGGSVEIQPSIRHMSIIIGDDDDDDTMSAENFKSQLRKLKTGLKVKQLHTLMIFGEMDERFAKILGDLVREANALRVLLFYDMPRSVVSMLHNFSALVHLRYLCLGTEEDVGKMRLPFAISRFYHLSILDLETWNGDCDLPKDLSNLAKLRHLYTPRNKPHPDILNVGKLVLLEELKVFTVNKESKGFEPEQLEHLNGLRELGIFHLENIHTKEEAAKAKLIEKNYLERLTLDWDCKRSNAEASVDAVVLESLQPHRYLEELCIRGHRGSSCPTWLGDGLAVEALQSLHLDGVSWQCLPPFGKMWGLGKVILKHISIVKEFVIEKNFCQLIRLELVGLENFEKWVPSEDAIMFPRLQVMIIRDCPKVLPFANPNQDWNIDWFPKLQELEIEKCPEFLLVACIPWTETLRRVNIRDVKLLEMFKYDSKSSNMHIVGKDGLQILDQIMAFGNLGGLEKLMLHKCPPLESKHLLMLTSLKRLSVDSSSGLVKPSGGDGDVEWHNPLELLVVTELRVACVKELRELLTHLPRLSKLLIYGCENITQLAMGVDVQQQTTSAASSEVDPSTSLPARGGDGFQALRSLQTSAILGSLFPSSMASMQYLNLVRVGGMGTLEPLSHLTSLTELVLKDCGEDLRCKGLGPLVTTGSLRKLSVYGSPTFFAEWDPDARRMLLQQDEGGEEQERVSPPAVCSSKLQELESDSMGLLVAPICSLLSSSLTYLLICEGEMELFTKEQVDALQLLATLQELHFFKFKKLQHLPEGLHKLTNLKALHVRFCPAIRSLPKDGLPKSLQELHVDFCGNEELKNQCRGLVGTIPKIRLDWP